MIGKYIPVLVLVVSIENGIVAAFKRRKLSNMNKLIKLFILSALLLASASIALAAPVLTQAANFNQVNQLIEQTIKQYGSKGLLLVFDDDDTLLTASQDLGSVAWEDWQTALLQQYKTTHQVNPALIAHSMNGIYAAGNTAEYTGAMRPTDVNIPRDLTTYINQGAAILVATARDPSRKQLTEHEFLLNHFTDHGQLLFSLAEPTAVTYTDFGSAKRPLLYADGILFLTGQQKGPEIQAFLSKNKLKQIDSVVFVDDQLSNVDSVYSTLSKDHQIHHLLCIHYLKENSRVTAFLHDFHHEQEASEKAWSKLKATRTHAA